eukprot:Blabericola_migrator_1__13554@NODE_992_length_5778_cov_12_714411_g669_i1_p4_GENE_NODE_992_length_5778_cov_12_714411_g669_i1NODE_992_length_5778_cov_12_714411_g669_i1_p4_ORF_typecomplete_len147_score25_61_NODE_992_length_5778_cov_12_714411_g669_i145845024
MSKEEQFMLDVIIVDILLANAPSLPHQDFNVNTAKDPIRQQFVALVLLVTRMETPSLLYTTRVKDIALRSLMVNQLQRKLLKLEGSSQPLQTKEEQTVNVIVRKGKVSNDETLKPYGESVHPMVNNKMRKIQKKKKWKNKQKQHNR